MKKFVYLFFILAMATGLSGCATGGRVSTEDGDAMMQTDKWTRVDSQNAAKEIIKQFEEHDALKEYREEILAKTGHKPKLFIKEIDNDTSDTNFRINELNNVMLKELSKKGWFTIVNRRNADKINSELAYQRKGTVKQDDVQSAIKESGADTLIFGQVSSTPVRKGKQKVNEYTLNVTITNIETKEEIAIADFTTTKFTKGGMTW